MISLEERERLINTKGATLDGVPAGISGRAMPFATVWQREHIHYCAQWSWEAVQSIMMFKGGKFSTT